MRYLLFALLVASLASASSGCNLCCSPYDYCGPVHVAPCGECCPVDREGSAFGGAYAHYHGGEYIEYEGGVMESTPAPRSSQGEEVLSPVPEGNSNQTMQRGRPAPAARRQAYPMVRRPGPSSPGAAPVAPHWLR